jgi:quinol monooxygenase YgiN
MSDKITLIVRFELQEADKMEFVSRLKEVFAPIEREETFVEASLQQDLGGPKSLLVYEVWRETPESFMKNQMTKEYRKGFEQAIVDLKVDRTPSWYTTLAEWKKGLMDAILCSSWQNLGRHVRLYVQRRLACSVGGGKKTHRGKSQKPRSLDSREEGDQILEVYRRSHPWDGCESSGRNKSKRIVTSKMRSPEAESSTGG